MLVERIIEPVKQGKASAFAELLKAIPEYGPAPPHKWRVYRPAHLSPWDEVIFETEWESGAEREAWWKSWSGSTPEQKEWHAKRKELVERGGRSELWQVDEFG